MALRQIWGCDARRQFETAWVQSLLSSVSPSVNSTVLVESGLLLLERSPTPERVRAQTHAREDRLAALTGQAFTLIHLSDEEGFDGDALYPQLPPNCRIWRNFPHKRFNADLRVRSFPIGPRDCFLVSDDAMAGTRASQRTVPWAFMGTLWASGSRTEAVSHFLRSLPQGTFFGGKAFGTGLPLARYRHELMQSVFALAPEGDRHLDTFRLWESLCCGCIPLLVDHRHTAAALLGSYYPGPVFVSWPQALQFAQNLLQAPHQLDRLQAELQNWWQQLRHTLQQEMHAGLFP